jgi:eukaryotic-like serine/threonine-protein kinase
MTAGVLLLVAFAVVQSFQLRRIRRERDRADRITQFMTGMFKISNPSEARGNTVTAREILDKASREIGTGLAHDPALQAQMMQTMAGTYSGLDFIGKQKLWMNARWKSGKGFLAHGTRRRCV